MSRHAMPPNDGDDFREAVTRLANVERRRRDWPDIPQPPTPSGGGARVYCDQLSRTLDSGSDVPQLFASVGFTLDATSTVNIQIAYTFSQHPADLSVPAGAFAWAVDSSPVVEPPLRLYHPVVTTATTLGAGAHSISTALTTPNLNFVLGTVMLVVIVGDDTSDNCVTIA